MPLGIYLFSEVIRKVKSWMIYEKIQEMKRNKLNKSQVSRHLGIDYKTVMKYWDIPPDGFAKKQIQAKERTKKSDKYKDIVLECLQKYPDMTAAQIYDRVKELTGQTELDVKERAFRNYIVWIRNEYDIKKPDTTRQYEAVADPPMGSQGQVDMGEISLETESGRHKKVYAFGMVLSHSRYKFIYWIDHPWTTADFVDAHIKAFTYFGGMPRQIVYDQDKVLAVSENHGDIIYTAGFQNYLDSMGFDIYLCRGSDPESKGRIENVIKYAKHGFAEHRIFGDIDSLNDDCIAWLERTGNAKVHETTKKIPAEVFALEKEYLIPVSEYSFEKPVNASINYLVRKDNVVLYKSNRYRVPKGTYSKGKKVHVIPEGNDISIVDALTGEIYATHPICLGKGELIGSSTHDKRDMSQSLKELDISVKSLFDNNESVINFLSHVHKEKVRYYRDQLLEIRKLHKEWDTDIILEAIDYCNERSLYSVSELKSTIYFLSQFTADSVKVANAGSVLLPEKYRGGAPPIRELSIYETIMERSRING